MGTFVRLVFCVSQNTDCRRNVSFATVFYRLLTSVLNSFPRSMKFLKRSKEALAGDMITMSPASARAAASQTATSRFSTSQIGGCSPSTASIPRSARWRTSRSRSARRRPALRQATSLSCPRPALPSIASRTSWSAESCLKRLSTTCKRLSRN